MDDRIVWKRGHVQKTMNKTKKDKRFKGTIGVIFLVEQSTKPHE